MYVGDTREEEEALRRKRGGTKAGQEALGKRRRHLGETALRKEGMPLVKAR